MIKNKHFPYVIIVLLILLICSVGFSTRSISKLEKENQLYKIILKADKDFSKVSIDSQWADQYYDEASYDYEDGNYKSAESNSRLAREYFSKESQGYKTIKAELKATKIEDNLIYIYVGLLDSIIEATNNVYEASEHFESAVRYYDIYYNTNVPYNDMSFEMGNSEIDAMNENIGAHDNAVEKYNQYLEDFRVELENRLK